MNSPGAIVADQLRRQPQSSICCDSLEFKVSCISIYQYTVYNTPDTSRPFQHRSQAAQYKCEQDLWRTDRGCIHAFKGMPCPCTPRHCQHQAWDYLTGRHHYIPETHLDTLSWCWLTPGCAAALLLATLLQPHSLRLTLQQCP